jgi:glucose-6-phosphate 1-dehydrogenase
MAKIIPVETFDCVVFGATGDLTLRKLLPALYYRCRDGQVPNDARIIGAARSDLDDQAFRDRADAALKDHVPANDLDPTVVHGFLERLHYARIDATDASANWDGLKALLDPKRVHVFYLATAPDLYGPICRNLGSAGLVTERSRVVLEKPIGHDLDSARDIIRDVGEVFTESQTFRIDHYLGKETVQNLMALRFANTIFERVW